MRDLKSQELALALDTLAEPFQILDAVRGKAGEIVDFRFVFVNTAVSLQTRFGTEELRGKGLLEVFPDTDQDLLEAMERVANGGRHEALYDLRYEGPTERGPLAWVFDCAVSRYGDGVVLIAHQSRPLGAEADRISFKAAHDDLTGLLDRNGLRDRLEQAATENRRYGTDFSLALMDIDNFKALNDTEGHEAGDAALVKIAALLEDRIRSSDIAARLGGDEFAILMPQTAAKDAETAAHEIREAIAQLPLGSDDQPITASIGLASAGPDDRTDAVDVLRKADRASYLVKVGGGNGVRHWNTADQAIELFETAALREA